MTATAAVVGAPAGDRLAWPESVGRWVERLPLPAWLTYAIIAALSVTFVEAVALLSATALTPLLVVGALLPPYILAMGQYLAHAARRAARSFRPLLGVDAATYASIEHDLATIRPRTAVVASVVAGGLGLAGALAIVSAFPELPDRMRITRPVYLVAWVPLITVAYVIAGPLIVRTVRQLRLIEDLHATAPLVDPLRSTGVTAFSTLTLRITLVLFAPLYAFLFGAFEWATTIPVAFAPIVVGNMTATIIFVRPLLGLHARLEASRGAHLDAIGERLERAIAELNARVDRMELEDVGQLKTTIDALAASRDLLLKAQTWPWRPGTLNAFITVFGAPILIYLATRFLARFL